MNFDNRFWNRRMNEAQYMRYLIYTFFIAGLMAFPLLAAEGGHDLDNEVVCRVNMEVISKRDIDRQDPYLARLHYWREELKQRQLWNQATKQQFDEAYFPRFREQLRQAIQAKLMLHEAKKQGLKVNPATFDTELQRRLNFLQEKGMLNRPGFTYSEIKEDLERSQLIDEFKANLINVLDIPSPREIQKYYRENIDKYQQKGAVKVRRIRIDRIVTNALGERLPRQGASELADKLRNEILAYGSDVSDEFATLAREHTDDPEPIKSSGGLLRGPKGEEYLDPENDYSMRNIIAGLKVGEVSRIFDLEGKSWAFILLEERRPPGPRPLDEELTKEIQRILTEKMVQRKEDRWLRDSIKNSLILDSSEKPIPMWFFFPDDPQFRDDATKKAEAESISRTALKDED